MLIGDKDVSMCLFQPSIICIAMHFFLSIQWKMVNNNTHTCQTSAQYVNNKILYIPIYNKHNLSNIIYYHNVIPIIIAK